MSSSPDITFAGSELDRATALRDDPSALQAALQSPAARFVLFDWSKPSSSVDAGLRERGLACSRYKIDLRHLWLRGVPEIVWPASAQAAASAQAEASAQGQHAGKHEGRRRGFDPAELSASQNETVGGRLVGPHECVIEPQRRGQLEGVGGVVEKALRPPLESESGIEF